MAGTSLLRSRRSGCSRDSGDERFELLQTCATRLPTLSYFEFYRKINILSNVFEQCW